MTTEQQEAIDQATAILEKQFSHCVVAAHIETDGQATLAHAYRGGWGVTIALCESAKHGVMKSQGLIQ